MRPVRARLALGAAALLALGAAAPPAFVPPGPRDRCPVCGMFVARTPDWAAEVVLADGTHLAFDGARDLFLFLADPGRWVPGRSARDVTAAFVTDYYAVVPVDARAAFYVLGSDVLGPMGHELVPFAREGEAREFLADHHGRGVLRFDEVTAGVLAGLGSPR